MVVFARRPVDHGRADHRHRAEGGARLDAGIAAGFNNTVSRVGGLVAVALAGIVVSVAFRHAGGGDAASALEADASGAVRAASLTAFRWAIVFASALCLLGSAVAAFGLRDPAQP